MEVEQSTEFHHIKVMPFRVKESAMSAFKLNLLNGTTVNYLTPNRLWKAHFV